MKKTKPIASLTCPHQIETYHSHLKNLSHGNKKKILQNCDDGETFVRVVVADKERLRNQTDGENFPSVIIEWKRKDGGRGKKN